MKGKTMKKLILMAGVIVLAAVAIAAQCAATTKKGTQCKRQASAGSLYCWQHGKTTSQGTAAVPSPRTDSLVQCKAITKAGTKCQRKPSRGSNYCWQHRGDATEKPALTVETKAQKTLATEAKSPVVSGGTCTATTKDGKRCSRKAKSGSDKCWQHAQ